MSARRLRPKSSNARHHAEWLGLMDVSGPFLSLPVLDRIFPQGLDPHDPVASSELRHRYADWTEEGEDPKAHRTWGLAVLQRTLELPKDVLLEPEALTESLDVRVAQHHETLRPDLVIVNPPGRPDAGRPRILIQIVPRGQDLEKPLGEAGWKASPATRMTELLHGAGSKGVRLGLLTNGEQWMLVHAPRGETAGYATWQAELWLEEPVTLRAFRSLLSARRLFGVPAEESLEALYEASVNDQQEVTDRLGSQVRHAVEVLVRAIDSIDQDRQRGLLEGFDEKQLYSAAVTVMMRLVFLLYAEEQNLLPIEDPFYTQHYAASTLLEQLQDDEDKLGEQVLDRRYAAWNRLLATFRAVHGGIDHESLRLPAYGGGLFDPDRYPFLEGRPVGSMWREVSAHPLPISDSTVLDLLRSIQFLEIQGLSGGGAEAQRLSFKALGVEQIGHVYESLLDHTAVRAESAVIALAGPREPEIALVELEGLRRKGQEAVVDFLTERTGRSRKAIENALEYEVEPDDTRWLVSCGNDAALVQRVLKWAGLVREDSHGLPIVIPEGSVYATKGSDRRSTGTHYTPRSLTEPIVQYTLEPLVYDGPAEGKPQDEWVLRSAREILALKVCDMACGSGAFLVQACRYLSERLVDAWGTVEAANPGHVVVTPEGELSEARPSDCIIPKALAERLVVARRLVADRCIYGVDVNPMAVEMAKLSLWLVTLEKNRPFSFVDHAIKCGDALIGVTSVNQIKDFGFDRDEPRRYLGVAEACDHAVSESDKLRQALEALPVVDIRDAELKSQLLQRADDTVATLRAVGDILVAEALADTSGRVKEGDHGLSEVPMLLLELAGSPGETQKDQRSLARLEGIATGLLSSHSGGQRRPFHWPLEFPEAFDNGGFAGFVGNPPFLWGMRISSILGDDYLKLLQSMAGRSLGTTDLCVHFLRRAAALLRPSGMLGLVLTAGVIEGDAREVGLAALVQRGYSLTAATSARPWPGAASVRIVTVHLTSGPWQGNPRLDGEMVAVLDSRLTTEGDEDAPQALDLRVCSSFVGHYLMGDGFILTPEERAELLRDEPASRRVVFPYLRGRDLNQTLSRSAEDFALNFGTLELGECERRYPEALARVRKLVKPYRDKQKRKANRERWWQYAEVRPGLSKVLKLRKAVLVQPSPTKYIAPTFVAAHQVFASPMVVIDTDDYGLFGVLQSSLHREWVHKRASRMGETLRYTSADCLATFPLPESERLPRSEGRKVYDLLEHTRQSLRLSLTELFNRLHDSENREVAIRALREALVMLDTSVAEAYGWQDLELCHGFYQTPYGLRFGPEPTATRQTLGRLLKLNRSIAAGVGARLGQEASSMDADE